MQKILIFGASGLVGRALIEEFRSGFDLFGTYSTSLTSLPDEKQSKLELQEIDKMTEMIRSIKPDIVISCLRGEFDQQFKFHKALAMELVNYKSRLYYFSTTNVFDGDYSKPHTESDLPVSESDYGKFKIECENMLKEILNDKVMTIRIPAIWGKDSPRWNIIKESIRNNKMIDVYSNLVCSNLSDVLLAKQLRFIIEKDLKGIFHLGSVDKMTQGQFYEEILSKLGSDTSILRYHLFQDQVDTYFFRLISDRDDVSSSLQCKNAEIIAYLME
ncbi:sugar nucleotide-binding protein [Paenibacillus aceris]|uniref:dTDP-4-dehydrorhamnose reductase n=1 Tax=Paenibacillus aceris TaxID=869555 RepID=A0ABS4I048_9BACL|nr:sugar nucleotide-binding protein [Paenibacillus aceris]MBP1964297.1 dTDP-4-dehydrorhamnose reductase [Paenibacillus aceris]NHW36617.1 sugar nucleotide-binding protein [Paenibacillus aceris]